MPKHGEKNFELEDAIAGWRRELISKRVDQGSLEELERHLRDAIQHQVAGGKPVHLAFDEAMKELGTPDRLAKEFAKNGRLNKFDLVALALVASSFVFVCLVCAPIYLLRSMPLTLPLLTAHVISFITGFWCAVLGGFCGVYSLARRDVVKGADERVEALFRKITVALCALVFIGSLGALVTGLFFAKASGVSAPWYDYRHLGNTALILWSSISLAFIICGKISTRWHFLNAIIGSLIVSDFLLLRSIVEGHFGTAVVIGGIFFYALQLVPLWRHWSSRSISWPELA